MNKKDIEKLNRLSFTDMLSLEFDNIYVVPTNKKSSWYRLAYYIWRIGDEFWILDMYDCWDFSSYVAGNMYSLRWDFEDIFWWIKFWSWLSWLSIWKLKYDGSWRIRLANK